jgi:asparagine synthase (glutamine-hydrolysing)
MSGIAGIINLDGAPIDRYLLWRMTDFMAFRGPDTQEVWIDQNVGFGHTMLRTTSEAETEKQPLTLDHKVWLNADARIDARKELFAKLQSKLQRSLNLTPTDAELILLSYEAWGEECVNHLLGDFAFAIWDSLSRRLFCARDQFGVKPFFFARVSNSFIFSNTLNALRLDTRVSDALNEVAIGDYLVFGLNQDLLSTAFRDIQRVPPGHTLTLSKNSITTRPYWTLAITNPIRFRDRHSYVERFEELLTSAIADRLRTDRVAISMSGGLDSTSLAAIASNLLDHKVHGCANVYDSLIPDEERHYSTVAANHLDIPITHINAAQYSLFDARQPSEMNQPEPFLISPLTGQFNDLLRVCAKHGRVGFTGYDGDSFMHEASRSSLAASARRLFRTQIKRILGKQPVESLYPEWIDESFAKRINLRDRLRKAAGSPNKTRPAAFAAFNSKVWAPLFESYDPGATRLQLEMRHPLIDLRLIDYLLAIPAVPWCVNKHILRVTMKNRLPTAVLNRRKTPLAGDPALQLARHASVRWLDSFEVNPQLKSFVNLNLRRPIADEQISDGLWASLRVFALNYWLTNSQPFEQRTTENQVDNNRAYKTSIA